MTLLIVRVPVPHADHSTVHDGLTGADRAFNRASHRSAVGRPERRARHPVEKTRLQLLRFVVIFVVRPDGSQRSKALVAFSDKEPVVTSDIPRNLCGREF